MDTQDKARQLRSFKRLATGLFLSMLVLYAAMEWLSRGHPAAWVGYVRAFSEAAMVGALADWFAVTALFHYPLGIRIPHTNLIENSKNRIGSNLGDFVVTNFLNAGNIRPYIQKLAVSAYAAQWFSKDRNKKAVVSEVSRLLLDILNRIDDALVARFIARKGGELLTGLKLNVLTGNALQFFLEKGEHQQLVTLLAQKLKGYIRENEAVVRERVASESYFFIPRFVDNKLAAKITAGLITYFEEIEEDPHHQIRAEIAGQLRAFAEQLRTEPGWEERFNELKQGLLASEKVKGYAAEAWQSLKATLVNELSSEQSATRRYFIRTIDDLAGRLSGDPELQEKIDGWIRMNGYRYILRNREQVSTLISNTVGAWEGRELSRKLELEVGKDLQYIRINGTIVGGAVGLLIYTLTQLLG